ncbi:MAG: ATP synthase F1 subunit epsilon [Atopobiaceae bacterium]|jgi:F-type H+-transporting ATPase subunit epsilon|nr:ATP synthase F1 subunit epsilon [Atopobiaceae bacterium]MBQ9316351.1 ATP synthase F1 subunit epsilon [Atopobiaceae bacterium]
MATITCQFVRPDRLLFEGEVASLVLVTPTGELGVWPGHAPEICALGNGVVRLHRLPEDGGATVEVIISGGYVEITPHQVIVLADHARRSDDIDADVVNETRDKAVASRDALPAGDGRRAYYDNKIAWCDLLLRHAPQQD